ncbi:MAG: hypothetical protein NVS1B14_03720 [Vulcanimicrobiaceae bacterium]
MTGGATSAPLSIDARQRDDAIRVMIAHASSSRRWVAKTFGEATDDILQTALAAAITNAQTEHIRFPKAYFASILRYTIIRFIRDRQQDRLRNTQDARPFSRADAAPSAEAILLNRDRRKLFVQMLAKLSPRERELLLRVADGQDAHEICQAMRITPTQFRLSKSRGKLKCIEMVRRSNMLLHSNISGAH